MFPAALFLLLTLICEGAASSSPDMSTGLDKTRCTSVTYDLMAVGCSLAVLILCVVFCAFVWKYKRDKDDLQRKNTSLQNQLQNTEKERDDAFSTLQEQKDVQEKQREELEKQREELEKQRHTLGKQLDENEREREENKQKLQSVEGNITQREKMFDKPEELLREKENLLQAQWKLDETKKMLEKQILDREKLLEPIENLLRSNRQRDVQISLY